MPFQDDSGIQKEIYRGPFLGGFSVFLSQVERMIPLNIAWAINQLPMVAAFAFPSLPIVLRVLFWIYSGAVIFPATAVLFRMTKYACEEELLRLESTREAVQIMALPGWRSLFPLYSVLIWLALLAWWLATMPSLRLLDVLARLVFLFLATFSLYWGPVLADDPQCSPLAVLRRSARLAWRFPWQTFWVGLTVLVFWILGVISIGGFFLAVPVLTACIQTQLFRRINRQTKERV